MNENEIYSFYNIPKETIDQFKDQLKELEKIRLPDLNEDNLFQIYKLLYRRIQIFLDYSAFYRELEQKKDLWKPPGTYKKDELEELKAGYERDMRVQWKMLQAIALEGDWLLRKIVGSPEKMEEFKDKLLDEDH